MRTIHWVIVLAAVIVAGAAQTYALTAGNEPALPRPSAEVHEAPDVPQAIVAESRPQLPAPVETVIVGFKSGLGSQAKEAFVRAAGGEPTDIVGGPQTIVATVESTALEAAIAQLEANLLVDYVAVPEQPASILR